METLIHSTTHKPRLKACTNFPVQNEKLDQHYGQLESLIIQVLPHKMPLYAAKIMQYKLSPSGFHLCFLNKPDFSFTSLSTMWTSVEPKDQRPAKSNESYNFNCTTERSW